MTFSSSVWRPYCTATINGTAIDTQILLGGRVETSLHDPVSKGYVKCISAPSFSQGDGVSITLGGGNNNITRMPSGTILQGDWLNSGPTFELICRGPLFAAQKYRNNYPLGLTLTDLTSGPATDQAIAQAVLTIAGVPFSSSNIGGTGIVRGTSAAIAYTWRKGESALEYLNRLSKASLGYKMIETTNGAVFRTQVLGTPSGSPDFTLTEGVDIFEGAHTQIETFDTYSAWSVTGFDYGDGLGAVSYSNPGVLPAGVVPYAFSSEMIESATDADLRGGISAQTVCAYVQGESNRPITKVTGLQTPRDDLFGPGQIHQINSALLGLSGVKLWVLAVTAETDDKWFRQTLEYVG